MNDEVGVSLQKKLKIPQVNGVGVLMFINNRYLFAEAVIGYQVKIEKPCFFSEALCCNFITFKEPVPFSCSDFSMLFFAKKLILFEELEDQFAIFRAKREALTPVAEVVKLLIQEVLNVFGVMRAPSRITREGASDCFQSKRGLLR
jgi:hypothetical protein